MLGRFDASNFSHVKKNLLSDSGQRFKLKFV